MNPERVQKRGLEIKSMQPGLLPGYKLVFNKVSTAHPDNAHANVQFDRTSEVEGVLYQLMDSTEIQKMDVFENAPINYSREVVKIGTSLGVIAAWTYFANAGVLQWGKNPTSEYLEQLLAGRQFLSEAYYDRLLRQPTTGS